MRDDRRSRDARDETGQVMVLTAVAMVMLLVMVALVVDIGKAYLVQRQLQASVDAAALAGAQHLPNATDAATVAEEYGPKAGSPNAITTGYNVETTITPRCVKSAPGCNPSLANYNAVNIKASTDVEMLFARILGIKKLKVRASATACSPCSAKPLDIMIVLDRTGSMCQFGPGQNDPACTDLVNAKDGIRTFLQLMDPTLDKVGLAVFPPARVQSEIYNCPSRPTSSNAYYGYDSWWPYWGPWPDTDGDGDPDPPGNPSYYVFASLDFDYLSQDGDGNWIPNLSSRMFDLIGWPMNTNEGCIQGNGTTHYASAIEEAQYELNRNGRGDVQDVIIFVSDGAANTSPNRLPAGHWRLTDYWTLHPCGAGVQAAANAKSDGDKVYSIGYDLDAGSAEPEKCRQPNLSNGHMNGSNPVESGYDAYTAIQAIASPECGVNGTGPCFYNAPNPVDLSGIFTRIAADLQRPAARLIDDNTP